MLLGMTGGEDGGTQPWGTQPWGIQPWGTQPWVFPMAWGPKFGFFGHHPRSSAHSGLSPTFWLPSRLVFQAREELRPVKEDFEAKNKQLLEEMPKFYSSRIDYFKPSFESLVRAQVR